eukprot:CAMPEP_0119550314 /NCGR_PEP_ID=MMETSP1352-20130426/3844_1 /TAXON_ID=265584 /ORGANISM="Stauroneis constricta, Strain CCMP1120" /LENGTH=371 /DNA_ID=CAMNT_0007596115 /DNA_START=303 /DNA_END=1418 /DNA_ORIENTATION=+
MTSDSSSTDLEEGIEHAYLPSGASSASSGQGSKAAANDAAADASPRAAADPPATCGSRLRCLLFVGFVVVGLVVGLSLILTGRANPVAYFVPVDPPGKSEANRWDATAGLTLMVENACTDEWAPYFEASVKAWNQTDALDLRTSRVAVDPECSPRNGRFKVCNSDYGETPWHGINIILVDKIKGTIVHSISQLNDRFMEDDFDRTYIMCHENGHGFGLPHTDEDHFNRDRGDCMDYTIRPRNNQVPGDFNLDLLVKLYGTRAQPLLVDPKTLPKDGEGQSQQQPDGTNTPRNTLPLRPPVQQEDVLEDKKNKDKDKDRRHLSPDEEDIEITDADIIAMDKEAVRDCQEELCVVEVNDQYRILVNQFLRASL